MCLVNSTLCASACLSWPAAGSLARIIERGSRGINFMLGALVFNVAPTALEVGVVAAILTAKCGPGMGALTVSTLAGAPLLVAPYHHYYWPCYLFGGLVLATRHDRCRQPD